MSFYRKVKYFLVHTLMLSNKRAQELIASGLVEIDGKVVTENCFLEEHSEVKVNGKTERRKKLFTYLKFYKPAGFESTLNHSVPNNLSVFFENHEALAIAGRLDKQSEGLLLLSNDGKWVEYMCNPKFEKEKEYIVTLDKEPGSAFLDTFRNGVRIGTYITQPCSCEIIENTSIRVILKEGKNRQIRRMCKVLGYSVLKLKRVRIDNIQLSPLEPGEMQSIKKKYDTNNERLNV